MPELSINTTEPGLQHQPAVARLGASHFLVVWVDDHDFTIKGRLVQTDGSFSSDEFEVSDPASQSGNTRRQFPVAIATASGPVVAWIETAINPPGPRPHVKLQRFDRDGRKIGGETQVSASDVDPAHRPALTAAIDGGFVVVWLDARQDQRVRAQRFSIDGAKKGAELALNTTDGFHQAPTATLLPDGNYVVAWRSDPAPPGGGPLIFRIFDFEGTPVVDETRPNLSGFQGEQAITALDDGRFVIVHVRRTGLSDIGVEESVVEAHVIDPSGVAAMVPIGVSSGRHQNTAFPAVAPLPNKRFLAAWVQKSAETFSTVPVVKAGMFSGEGTSIGPEVDISGGPEGARASTSLAAMFELTGSSAACLAWTQDLPAAGGSLNRDIRGALIAAAEGGVVQT